MKILSNKDKSSVEKAVMVLQQGGVVVFPTDTAYGLGVDATNDEAVNIVYELKGRESGKPMHVVVSDIDMANRYMEVNKRTRTLAEAFLPGALTLVLKDRGRVSHKIVSENGTLGFRVPDNDFALLLASKANIPITATSANKSGDITPYSIEEIKKSFGSDFEKIDLVIDAGTLPKVIPSTLVDMTATEPVILREGPISREEILEVIG